MFSFPGRLIYVLSNKISGTISRRRRDTAEFRLIADFNKPNKSLFEIKSETFHNAYLSNGSLALELKKPNYIGWTEIPDIEFGSYVTEAKIRLDNMGGYSSAGIIFRLNEDSYYLALISDKGYFRIDAVKENAPKALIAWSEISDFDGTNIHLKIIAYGDCFIFIINGKWVGEVVDDSVSAGHLGFVLASYETAAKSNQAETETVCKAWLDYFSADTRSITLEEQYKYWTTDSNIYAEGRLRLAETFAVMGKFSKALEQIKKTWKCRNEAIRAVSTSASEVRTKKELILAARMAFSLEQYNEAEEYIDHILEQWPQSAEGKLAYTEKLKILNELNKFKELKEFALKHSDVIEKNIDYFTILARCYWKLKEYADSAKAWNTAFRMNGENGVYAANAANALELIGKKKEALAFFIKAAKVFLTQDNQAELAVIMPKLSVLGGGRNWEARALAGKWAFSIEDYSRCIKEFTAAEKLRLETKPKPAADPALFYLWGLSENVMGRIRDAIRMLEKAVKLAPGYGLFRFKLAELKLTAGVKNIDIVSELKLALKSIDDNLIAEMANHAGNLILNAGDAKSAKFFFDKANKAAEAENGGKKKK